MVKAQEEEAKLIHQRLTKKIEQEKVYAIQKFSLDLLEILDNFDRFFENYSKMETGLNENNEFMTGLTLIYKNALKTLKAYGIHEMEVNLKEKANFDKHNVVFCSP